MTISETVFANEKLLSNLVPIVVDSLGSAYPEIPNKQTAILELIAHEQEVFKALRESSSKAFTEVLTEFPNLEDIDLMECPGFVPAYRDFQSIKHTFKNNKIPGDFLYKLTDTYGLTEENFQKLAQLEEMSYDITAYKDAVTNAKLKAKGCKTTNDQSEKLLKNIEKSLLEITKTLTKTDNHCKYNYSYNTQEKQYIIPTLKTKVLGILYNDVVVEEVVCNGLTDSEGVIFIITQDSNFYYESGGQQSDKGSFIIKTLDNKIHELKISNVRFINDCVVHQCELPKEDVHFTLATGDDVELKVDATHRKRNICHHTGI